MRFSAFLLFFAVALSGRPFATNEAAIRELIKQYVAIRNHYDAVALRRIVTPEIDQLVSSGQWRRGLDDFLRGTAASSSKEAGQSSVTVETIRLLGPDVALVDGAYQTVSANAAHSAPPSIRKMHSTFVVQRVHGRWLIAAIRNMLPSPQM